MSDSDCSNPHRWSQSGDGGDAPCPVCGKRNPKFFPKDWSPTPGSEALPLTDEELVLMRHPDRATLPIELRLLATIAADRTKIARLEKIEARIRCATAALETIDEREGMKWEVARDILAHLDHILEGSNDG